MPDRVPLEKTYSLGPLGLTRWGTFGAWTIRVGRAAYEIHHATRGRCFANGRRWLVNKRQWA